MRVTVRRVRSSGAPTVFACAQVATVNLRRFEGEGGGGVRLADARQGIAVAVIERADLLGVVVPLFNFEP